MTTNLCRICLNQGFLISIFKKNGSLMLSTKLMSLAKIQITPDDDLPHTICSKCVKKLDECLEFIELCEKSDKKLRLSDNKPEDILLTKYENIILDDDKLLFVNDDSLSPKSETDKVLLIDESVDNCNSLLLNDNVLENETNVNTEDKNKCKLNPGQSRKQQCFVCGKVMSSRFRLKTHLRSHTGERPFTCSHCNKNFSLAYNLKVHMRIHSGEKPLQCTFCGESFAHSAGLAAHKRKHTGQMPYQCLLCPRAFRTIGHLQYHTRWHTGEKKFECDTCSRAFITRSDLKQHLLIHSGERPHVCCTCGLRLTRASHLKRHILTHNRKGFPCDTCPAKFNKKTDFDKHIKSHEQTKDEEIKLENQAR